MMGSNIVAAATCSGVELLKIDTEDEEADCTKQSAKTKNNTVLRRWSVSNRRRRPGLEPYK